MVAVPSLGGGLGVFGVLAGIADAAIALAATHGKVDTRVGVKIGADVAALGSIGAGYWLSLIIEDPTPARLEAAKLLYLVADFITCLEQVNGFGNSDRGGKFTEGAAKFYNNGSNDVYGILNDASVDPNRWSGPAAERYDAANTALKGLIHVDTDDGKMVVADKYMAEIVARQADQVTTVGEGLAGVRLTVLGGLDVLAAITMMSVATASTLLEYSIGRNYARKVAIAAGVAALGLVGTLVGQASTNRDEVFDAIRAYDEVAKNADAILPGPPRVHAVSGSAGSFSGISGMRSGTDGRVAVGAVSGAGSGDDSPTPETPSPCELIQLSGPAAKLSRQVSQSVNVVNPVMGPVQPLASMARQVTPAKQAPAKEAPAAGAGPEGATLAQDLAGAGVAPGAASAQSMPIEVVARTQPGPGRGAVAPSNALPPSKP